jgi:transposase
MVGKRDFEAMAKRRQRGVKLLTKGVAQAEIARRLGVKRQSVHSWAVAHRQRELSLSARSPGRVPKLRPEQHPQVIELLLAGPQAAGFATPLWTLDRVAMALRRRLGVHYHRSSIFRLLGQVGWSCQRPTGRARERKEAEITHWKRVKWPWIKKMPKRKGAPSSSSTKAD